MSSDPASAAPPPPSRRTSSHRRNPQVRAPPLTPTGIHLNMPLVLPSSPASRPSLAKAGSSTAGARTARPQRTGSSSSLNRAAHASSSSPSPSSSAAAETRRSPSSGVPSALTPSTSETAAAGSLLPSDIESPPTSYFATARSNQSQLREPFTSVTACSRSQSLEEQRSRSSTSRGGRRALLRSGTSSSLSVSSPQSLTPTSEVASIPDVEGQLIPSDEALAAAAGVAPTTYHGPLPFANADTKQISMVDDEACFVDPDKPRYDFVALLPFELALCIIYYLPSHCDVLQASCVSRTWRQIAVDNAVWRDRFFQNPGWAIRSDAELVLQRQDRRKKAHALAAKRREEEARLEQQRAVNAARSSALRSWRETLHIPSLPDLASLSLTATATLHIGQSATAPKQTTSGAEPSSSANAAGQGSISSLGSRFGFFSSPARGPSTPAGQKRARQSLLGSGGGAVDGNTPLSPEDADASCEAVSIASEREKQESRQESFVSSLDWRKLYKDRFILDQRWRRCRKSGSNVDPAADVEEGRPAKSSPRAFEPSKRYLLGHTDSVYCVQHDEGIGSGTPGKVVSGSRDWTIRVWDLETSKCKHILRGHHASVLSLQYDDRILVSGSSDSLVFVWDFATVVASQHQDETTPSADPSHGTAKSGPEAKANADGSRPMEHSGEMVVATLRGHSSGVLDVAFDDEWIISCSKDTTVRVWQRDDYSFYRRYSGHTGPVNAAGLQGGKVVSAAGDGNIHLWRLDTGETLHTFAGHERGLACIAFSGNMVISGSNDQTIRTWDASKGECLSIFKGHDHLVRAVAYDGRRRMIASGGYDRMIKLWDADAPERPVREIKAHTARIFDIEFDVTKVVSASEDQGVCVSFFGGKGIDTSLFV